MNPANVDFGNPNDNPTTFPAEMPKEQLQTQQQPQLLRIPLEVVQPLPNFLLTIITTKFYQARNTQ